MNELQRLIDDKKKAEVELAAAKGRLEEYWLQYYFKTYGIKPGVIVSSKVGEAIVESVSTDDLNSRRPWAMGRVRKKNGEFGKAVRHLYSHWECLKG